MAKTFFIMDSFPQRMDNNTTPKVICQGRSPDFLEKPVGSDRQRGWQFVKTGV